jgi:hypothetical protein
MDVIARACCRVALRLTLPHSFSLPFPLLLLLPTRLEALEASIGPLLFDFFPLFGLTVTLAPLEIRSENQTI